MRKLLTLTFIGIAALNASIEKNPVCYENQDLGYMKEYFAEPYEAGIQLRSSIREFRYWAYHFALAKCILEYNLKYNIDRFKDNDLNESFKKCKSIVIELLNHELERHKDITANNEEVLRLFNLYKVTPPEYTMGFFSDLLNGCMRIYLENNNCVQDDISKTLKDCFLKISDLAQKYWEK